MVTSCADDADQILKEKCANTTNEYLSFVPVVDTSHRVYRSENCARCNHITTYEHISLTGVCEKRLRDVHLPNVLNETERCIIKVNEEAKPLSIVYCEPDVFPAEKGCTIQSSNYELCQSYYGPFAGYFNIHCFICANPNTSLTGLEHHR